MAPVLNHPTAYGPPSTALLLLDYHEMIVEYMKDEETRRKVLSCARTLLDAARAGGAHIVHCLVDKDSSPVHTSKFSGYWESTISPRMAVKGDEHPDLAPLSSGAESKEWTAVRLAGRISALKSPGLISKLKDELQVRSVVLCGLSSSGCVLSTARNASDEDFVVSVVQEGCYDPKEGMHEAVMDILSTAAWVLQKEEAVRILKGSP